MPEPFFVSMYLVIIVALLVGALWTRDAGEHRADAAMTARGFADAAAAARFNLDGNALRSSAWQAPRDRGVFQDLEALANDGVILATLDVRNETQPTGIVLVGRIVKTLTARRPHR